MSRKIQLSIANPCHESWDDMTDADKGRFCASCQKQVIDFTTMSDSQLAAFFKKPSSVSVCGRFYTDQLDHEIEIPRKRIPWVKYFFQFALPAFLVSMKATAQGNVKANLIGKTAVVPKPKSSSVTVEVEDRITLMGDTVMAHAAPTTLKGRVVDENNNPVPAATVMVNGTTIGTVADEEGRFKLQNVSAEFTLEVSSIGYNSRKINLSKENDLTKELLIPLTVQVMGEVIVVGYPKYVKGDVAVGGVVAEKKSDKAIADSIMKSSAQIPAMIKVYPNPVVSGTNINVGCQKLKEGYYIVQLTTQSGQQVLIKQTWIDDELQVLNIAIPHIAGGVYFLKLTNKETSKRFTQKVIVE